MQCSGWSFSTGTTTMVIKNVSFFLTFHNIVFLYSGKWYANDLLWKQDGVVHQHAQVTHFISKIALFVIVSACRFDPTSVYPNNPDASGEYTGEGEGVGANFNFAFEAEGMEDQDYQPAFTAALLVIEVKLDRT